MQRNLDIGKPMRIILFICSTLLSFHIASAEQVSTNFWDKYSERVISLHQFIGEVNDFCLKEEAKELKLNNHAAIAAVQLLEAHLEYKSSKTTPLSELKKAVKVPLFLTIIHENNCAVTSRLLAFSNLTKQQKEELIYKIDRSNKLVTKLTTDVAEYIHNTAELGL